MMVVPFVSEATAARIRAVAARGFATRARVQGTVPVVFSRFDPDAEARTTTAPQDVLVEWADRAERGTEGEAAAATYVDGYLSRAAPFDVETDDLFSLGTEGARLAGRVAFVRPPDLAGVVRAGFVLRAGER